MRTSRTNKLTLIDFLENSNDFIIMHLIPLLTVNELFVLMLTSKPSKRFLIANNNVLIQNAMLRQYPTLSLSNVNGYVNWSGTHAKLKKLISAKNQLEEDKKDILDLHVMNRSAYHSNEASGGLPMILRKDTCAAGCVCAACSAITAPAICCFSQIPGCFAVLGWCFGFNLGASARTYQIKRRVKRAAEHLAAINAAMTRPVLVEVRPVLALTPDLHPLRESLLPRIGYGSIK